MPIYTIDYKAASLRSLRLLLRQVCLSSDVLPPASTLSATESQLMTTSSTKDDLQSSSSEQQPQHSTDDVTPPLSRSSSSKGPTRKPSGTRIRFADDCGLNLNTFAIIPPRRCRTEPDVAELERRSSSRPEIAATASTTTTRTDGGNGGYRLCFEQPFADFDNFRAKLLCQSVGVENVRVADWSVAVGIDAPWWRLQSSSSSSSKRNGVVLCSITVRNLHPVKRVFVRCTDDDWATYADLPAQRCPGIPTLGFDYQRFCVAIHKPVADASLVRESSEARHHASAVAVEFAVCYQAVGHPEKWDNNESANYRIEWI